MVHRRAPCSSRPWATPPRPTRRPARWGPSEVLRHPRRPPRRRAGAAGPEHRRWCCCCTRGPGRSRRSPGLAVRHPRGRGDRRAVRVQLVPDRGARATRRPPPTDELLATLDGRCPTGSPDRRRHDLRRGGRRRHDRLALNPSRPTRISGPASAAPSPPGSHPEEEHMSSPTRQPPDPSSHARSRTDPARATTPRLELSVGTAVTSYLAAGVSPARHRDPLRGEGQPAPRAAARARAGRLPLRRREPGRGAGRARGRAPRHPTSCTPTRSRAATTSRRRTPSGCGCSSSTRRGRSPRSRMPRRGRRCSCGSSPPASGSDWPLSRKYGCSVEEAVASSGRRSPRARPGRRLVPRRVAAARPAGVGARRSRRRHGCSTRCGRTASTRGCSTSAAGSPPPSTASAPPVADYGAAIDAHLTDGVRRRPAADARRAGPRRRRGCRHGRHERRRGRRPRAACAGSSSTPGCSPGWSRPSTRRSATASRRPGWAGRAGRACSPGRPATAPTCCTRRRRCAAARARRGRRAAHPLRRRLLDCYSTVGFNGFAPLPTVITR